MIVRLGNQSSMVVRQAEPKFTMEKMGDEGSTTPFLARILLGLLHIREMAYLDETERLSFDKVLDQALQPLLAARASARQIHEMWKTHCEKVLAGEVARMQGEAIHVEGDFNRRFRKEVHSFLYDAARALKEGMQQVGKSTGKDIGFMFQKPHAYQSGLEALRMADPVLAAYIQQTRDAWSEMLIKTRNDLDHEGWGLPRVTYEARDAGIVAHQPLIDRLPAVEFVDSMLDRLSCFIEEFTAYCFQSRMPEGVTITEIPMAERLAEAPVRFRLTLQNGGLSPWLLTYRATPFEEN
jgi:hypothetical protein